MIRLIILVALFAVASPAVHADNHKTKGNANKAFDKETQKEERKALKEAQKEERKALKEAQKEEREARKEAQKEEEAVERDGRKGREEYDREARGEKGREKAMAERNQDNSRREEALDKTDAKPWWRFWE